MEKITSLQNEQVKKIVRLRSSRGRKESQLTIVEGYCEVLRALDSKAEFTEAYICKEYLSKYDKADGLLKRFLSCRIQVYEVPETVYQKISFGDRKEGIVAVCKPKYLSFEDLPKREKSTFVVLEGIEKPGNLGAIFRSCDGAGVGGIIICDGCSDVYNPNVIRASIATVFSVKFVLASNEGAYHFFQSNGIKTYAALPDAKRVYFDETYQGRSAVVLGEEHNGLSSFWSDKADVKVSIPMKGMADSLNVSTSAAILIYEMLRQKF